MKDALLAAAFVLLAGLVMAVGLAALFMGRTDVLRVLLCGLGVLALSYIIAEVVYVVGRARAHERMARDLERRL